MCASTAGGGNLGLGLYRLCRWKILARVRGGGGGCSSPRRRVGCGGSGKGALVTGQDRGWSKHSPPPSLQGSHEGYPRRADGGRGWGVLRYPNIYGSK